jgi:hypothetical protein
MSNSAAVARFHAARAAVLPYDAAGLEAPAELYAALDVAQAALADVVPVSSEDVEALAGAYAVMRADGWDV